VTPSIVRLVQRYRPRLVQAVARQLEPGLGGERACAEAEQLLERLQPALEVSDHARPLAILQDAARRSLGMGASPSAVARATLALLVPDEVPPPEDHGDPIAGMVATMRPLFEHIPSPLAFLDTGRRVRLANESLLRLVGEPRAEVEGRAFDDLVAASARAGFVEWLSSDDLGANLTLGRFALAAAPDQATLATRVDFVHAGRRAGCFVAVSSDASQSLSDNSLGQLLQREVRQKEKFAALLAVSNAVVNSLDLNRILATIAAQVRQVIQTDECTVFLADAASGELYPAACDVEEYQDEMMAVRLRPGEGITGGVALSGRGEIVNDAESDPRAVQVPGTPPEASSLLCVPLFDRERVAGVITLVRVGEPRPPFQEQDLELATLFAGQCSAAIANARLYADMKQAYDELRETQTQLVLSAKLNALGEMAGGVAHDFNNILAAILGRTQLLLQGADDPELRRQLAVIEQAALDGAHTVRRVQEFTRVRQDESFETLDVNQVLLGVLELTRPAWEAGAKRRGIRIEVDHRLAATQTLAGNASELREVFTNLVLNAIDAMPWGGHLVVASEDAPGEVRVRIRDDGVGMDPDTRSRAFDPFFTTKQVKGTGLGLSVAYGIVTRHRGSIEVESEPDLGTEFLLRFPAGAVERAAAEAPVLGPLPRLRVLAVDDEEPVLSVLADLLRAMGQDVVAVLGGPAGIEQFQQCEFDAVFSDLGMPEVNGWDLALSVKSRRPEVAVVLVTGWGFQLESGAASAHGVDHILAKPFSIEDVERVLRTLGENIERHGRTARAA
jgi:signal transduction histidine kinase/CheY-like chemotaxis protein